VSLTFDLHREIKLRVMRVIKVRAVNQGG